MTQELKQLGRDDLAIITDEIPYNTIMKIENSGNTFYIQHYVRVPITTFRLDSNEWEGHESVYYIRESKYNQVTKKLNEPIFGLTVTPAQSVVTPTEELGRALANKLDTNERPRRNAWLAETNSHPTYNGHRGNVIFIKTSHFRP